MQGLEPWYDAQCTKLILGSFPSVQSRAITCYYGNPQNRFWPVLASVFHEQIPTSSKERKAWILSHHLALWDVVQSCTMHGSSDASIGNVIPNPIEQLLQHTQIKTIYTLGTTATKLYQKYFHLDYPHIALPSTSSANARYTLKDLQRLYEQLKA